MVRISDFRSCLVGEQRDGVDESESMMSCLVGRIGCVLVVGMVGNCELHGLQWSIWFTGYKDSKMKMMRFGLQDCSFACMELLR